jgi:hypothetical protein
MLSVRRGDCTSRCQYGMKSGFGGSLWLTGDDRCTMCSFEATVWCIRGSQASSCCSRGKLAKVILCVGGCWLDKAGWLGDFSKSWFGYLSVDCCDQKSEIRRLGKDEKPFFSVVLSLLFLAGEFLLLWRRGCNLCF